MHQATTPLPRHDAGDDALQRRHLAGDPRARDQLIERYLPLARGLAMRYRDRAEPLADLTQVAFVGLVAAVDRWDPERGTASWASCAATSATAPGWCGRCRTFRSSGLDVSRACDEFWQELGRAPTARDVAAHLGVSPEQVNDALQAGAVRAADSLDEPLRDGEEPGATALERVEDPRDRFEAADAAIALEQLGDALDGRGREVIRLRYREDLLQREIADRVGCSQMHVSRLLSDAVTALEQRAACTQGEAR